MHFGPNAKVVVDVQTCTDVFELVVAVEPGVEAVLDVEGLVENVHWRAVKLATDAIALLFDCHLITSLGKLESSRQACQTST